MYLSKLRPIRNISVINGNVLSTNTATSESLDIKENRSLKTWKEIPGPKNLPVIGGIHNFLPGGLFYNVSAVELSQRMMENYGRIVKLEGVLGQDPMVLLFDAESASHVLRSENWMPIRPGFKSLYYYRSNVKKGQKPGSPTGLITDHGENWRDMRTTVNPVLMQPKTMRLYTTVLDEVAMDMVQRLKSIRDENNMIKGNFDHEMNKWSLESIGVVALGCRLNCLDPNLPEDSPVKKLIQCVHDLFVIADQLDFKPSIWRYYATPTYKRAMKLYEEQETLSKFFIDKAMEEFKKKGKSEDEKGVLEKLLEINEDYALIMASDMLFAGVDTAANSLTGALYLLAKNPEKQNKLREEVLSGSEKRPYLKACMKEAIRLMPVTSGNMRLTTKEYSILGYNIPSGMQVVLAHQGMTLLEENFPQPLEFIPERWIADKDDPISYKNAHPFAYNPFGFGARSCIGRRIAELEMETFLGRMVEHFQVEWIGGPPKIVQTSLNYIKGPYNFVLKDVKK